MTQIITRQQIAAPALTAPKGTLLDAATVIDEAGFLEPLGLFETYACLKIDSQTAFPCPAVQISTPVLASAAASVGGTLTASVGYRYKLTAVNSRGETVASNEVLGTTTATNLTLTPSWSAVTGATGYRIYRTAAGGAVNSEVFLIQVGAVTSYADTGAVALGTGVPPTAGTAVANVTKTFTNPGWIDGIRFAVYGGATCKGMSFDLAESESQLRLAFLSGESRGVERALMQTRFTGLAGGAAATDLTPVAGAVDPAVGLALLEQDAMANYAGVPTIHVSRAIGSLLFKYGIEQPSGSSTFYSPQGSKIASGGGYGAPNNSPTNTAPPAGEQWIYGTGEVVVARSALTVISEIDRSTNDKYVLAERLYVAAVDCYVSAVRVKVA